MDDPSQRLLFRNCLAGHPLELVLEPWGMPLTLPPGAVAEVRLVGAEGPPEVDVAEGQITLYCASGSRIAVDIDGAPAYSSLDGLPVPTTPPSTSVRSLLHKLFK